MPNIALKCPYCQTEKAGFSGASFYHFKPGTQEYLLLLQCGVCGEGVIAKVRTPYISQWINGQTDQAAIGETWPKAVALGAPEHLPDHVRNFYLQGMDSLTRRNFDAAGTMFRKSLDVALKRIHPEGKGTLEKRIDGLPDAIGITPAMKDWAHSIRDLGNDAAHEEEPFLEGEAKALQAFTETFLTYAFTLPGMIEARKPKEAK
jgi:hypothetical protein